MSAEKNQPRPDDLAQSEEKGKIDWTAAFQSPDFLTGLQPAMASSTSSSVPLHVSQIQQLDPSPDRVRDSQRQPARIDFNETDFTAAFSELQSADENVVLQAHGITKGVLQKLINEPETITLVSEFVKEVLQKEDLQRAAVEIIASLLNHPETLAKIQDVMRNTVHSIVNHNETKPMLLDFIKILIEDQRTKDACHQLLLSLTQDTSIQEMLAGFFKSTLVLPQFQKEVIMLGKEVTNKVLHDKDIQKQTGDALWNALKYIMTPYWFRGGK